MHFDHSDERVLELIRVYLSYRINLLKSSFCRMAPIFDRT